jgi:hypothetical protein
VTDGDIQLGLRAKLRSPPTVYNSPDGTYVFSTGSVGNRALWNYEFSINLRTDGGGSLTFADLAGATLTILDVGTGVAQTVDPISYWADNTAYGSAGSGATNADRHSSAVSGDWSAQNSENLTFADSPLAGDVLMLTVTTDEAHGGTTATNSITVNAVPEPTMMSVFGIGLLGLITARRARRG